MATPNATETPSFPDSFPAVARADRPGDLGRLAGVEVGHHGVLGPGHNTGIPVAQPYGPSGVHTRYAVANQNTTLRGCPVRWQRRLTPIGMLVLVATTAQAQPAAETIIRGGDVFVEDGVRAADVRVVGSTIAEVGSGLEPRDANTRILDADGLLDVDDLPDDIVPAADGDADPGRSFSGADGLVGQPLADVERFYIEQALELVDGKREDAAALLGIGERTLYRKIKEYGLNQ